MGSKCGASSKKKSSSGKNTDPPPENKHSFINEVPFSEQEKEDENFDPRHSRLRLNHSMHKSSIVIVNDQTKEIKPVDKHIDPNFRFEDIVTITKENINNIYKVESQIVGISYHNEFSSLSN